jgi:Ca2+-dependent lipid-binding protein
MNQWNKKSENDYLGYASFDCKLLTDFIEAEVNVELDTQGSIDVKLIYYPGKAYGRIMKHCIENNQNFKDTQV